MRFASLVIAKRFNNIVKIVKNYTVHATTRPSEKARLRAAPGSSAQHSWA